MLTLLDEQKAKMDRLAIASLVQIETRQHFLLVFRTAFSKTDILLVRDYFVSTIHYLLKPSLAELISKFTDDAATGLTFALGITCLCSGRIEAASRREGTLYPTLEKPQLQHLAKFYPLHLPYPGKKV